MSEMKATRQCGTCGITFALTQDNFHQDRPQHPEEARRLSRRCKRCERERARWRNIERTYGVTKVEYLLLLAEQNGTCKICKKECVTLESLCVDHDHLTGKVRGLLCRKCNIGLGHFDDNVGLLTNAIEYLKAYV